MSTSRSSTSWSLSSFRNTVALQTLILKSDKIAMLDCPALNCSFLDQYFQFFSSNEFLGLDSPQPPPIIADADIAGLGVPLPTLHRSVCYQSGLIYYLRSSSPSSYPLILPGQW